MVVATKGGRMGVRVGARVGGWAMVGARVGIWVRVIVMSRVADRVRLVLG